MYDHGAANTLFLRGEYALAAERYHEGAREGDRFAAFNYGYCLWRGIGVEPDPAEAKSFFVYARDIDGGDAYYNLAMLYLHGEGVPRLYDKAVAYMRSAAENGCLEAQLYLGMLYTTGCVLEPDIIGICRIPFHKPEYHAESFAYLTGDVPDLEEDEDKRSTVVDADAHEAFLWFQTAARHDPTYVSELVAKGQYLYAKCFADGLGTDFDRQKAARLMLLAGRNGSQEAVAYLAERGIPPEQYLDRPRR